MTGPPLRIIPPGDLTDEDAQTLPPDYVAARRSVRKARNHLEKAAEEVLWQVENEAWKALGYDTWDAMRRAEYGGVAVMVPSKKRPELTRALDRHGLTQQQIADTVGVDQKTVSNDLRKIPKPPAAITAATTTPCPTCNGTGRISDVRTEGN